MATSVDQHFIRSYTDMVHHVLQEQTGNIRMTVRQANGITGNSHTFQVAGRGVAQKGKARHAPITPMNSQQSSVTFTIEDIYAGDWVDRLDQAKTNIDEMQVIAKTGAMAVERLIEQELLDAMVTGAGLDLNELTVNSVATIRQAANTVLVRLWERNFNPGFGTYIVVTPRFYQRLMFLDDFASADFVDVNGRPFVSGPPTRGQWRSWGGALWQQSNLLPGFGTSTAQQVAYDTDCVGFVDNGQVEADITWHGDRAAHFVNHMVGVAEGVIDSLGVVTWHIDDTAALPTT